MAQLKRRDDGSYYVVYSAAEGGGERPISQEESQQVAFGGLQLGTNPQGPLATATPSFGQEIRPITTAPPNATAASLMPSAPVSPSRELMNQYRAPTATPVDAARAALEARVKSAGGVMNPNGTATYSGVYGSAKPAPATGWGQLSAQPSGFGQNVGYSKKTLPDGSTLITYADGRTEVNKPSGPAKVVGGPYVPPSPRPPGFEAPPAGGAVDPSLRGAPMWLGGDVDDRVKPAVAAAPPLGSAPPPGGFRAPTQPSPDFAKRADDIVTAAEQSLKTGAPAAGTARTPTYSGFQATPFPKPGSVPKQSVQTPDGFTPTPKPDVPNRAALATRPDTYAPTPAPITAESTAANPAPDRFVPTQAPAISGRAALATRPSTFTPTTYTRPSAGPIDRDALGQRVEQELNVKYAPQREALLQASERSRLAREQQAQEIEAGAAEQIDTSKRQTAADMERAREYWGAQNLGSSGFLAGSQAQAQAAAYREQGGIRRDTERARGALLARGEQETSQLNQQLDTLASLRGDAGAARLAQLNTEERQFRLQEASQALGEWQAQMQVSMAASQQSQQAFDADRNFAENVRRADIDTAFQQWATTNQVNAQAAQMARQVYDSDRGFQENTRQFGINQAMQQWLQQNQMALQASQQGQQVFESDRNFAQVAQQQGIENAFRQWQAENQINAQKAQIARQAYESDRNFQENVEQYGMNYALQQWQAENNMTLNEAKFGLDERQVGLAEARQGALLPGETERQGLLNRQAALEMERSKATLPSDLATADAKARLAGTEASAAYEALNRVNKVFEKLGTAPAQVEFELAQLKRDAAKLDLAIAQDTNVGSRAVKQAQLNEINARIRSSDALANQRGEGDGLSPFQKYQMGRDAAEDARRATAEMRSAQEKGQQAAKQERDRQVDTYFKDYNVNRPAATAWVDFVDLASTPKADGSTPSAEDLNGAIAGLQNQPGLTYADKAWLYLMLQATQGNQEAQAALNSARYKRRPPQED